jgi:DNA-binding PadR family transcriptional regulator
MTNCIVTTEGEVLRGIRIAMIVLGHLRDRMDPAPRSVISKRIRKYLPEARLRKIHLDALVADGAIVEKRPLSGERGRPSTWFYLTAKGRELLAEYERAEKAWLDGENDGA